jgi:hypothetical protein
MQFTEFYSIHDTKIKFLIFILQTLTSTLCQINAVNFEKMMIY